jgi:LuxR family transcriptional regulator, maltose regulon positive regulatory protein
MTQESEIRMLRYLPTHMRAQEIAAELSLWRTLSRPEIATKLSVSANAINTQIQSIYAKLGVRDRSAAVQRARELRLLSAGRPR